MAAVDKHGGLMFNRRRQSQDRVLRQKIREMARESILWLSPYSRKQFESDTEPEIRVDEAFMEKAGTGEYCFIEDVSAAPYADRIEKIVLFHWNRDYPGDFFFDIDVSAPPWKVVESETEEFPGSSHEKITKEVFARE